MPDEIAGPIMCSGSTAYTSIKESGLRPGQWAVFPGGGGGVGMQAVQLAIAMGLRAIVIDTGSEREQKCLSYGADTFIDFKSVSDPVAEVLKVTNGGAHAVFVTAVQSYPIALGFLGHRAGAKVMCIGLPPAGKFNIEVNPSTLAFRNQGIMGTLVAGMADVDETLDFARRGMHPSEDTPTRDMADQLDRQALSGTHCRRTLKIQRVGTKAQEWASRWVSRASPSMYGTY